MVQFVRFSYYKTTNYTAPWDVVQCGTLLIVVRCGYVILQAALVWFLQFVRFLQFGEHPYQLVFSFLCNIKENYYIHNIFIILLQQILGGKL